MKEIYRSLQNSNNPLFWDQTNGRTSKYDNFDLNKNGYGDQTDCQNNWLNNNYGYQEQKVNNMQPIANYVEQTMTGPASNSINYPTAIYDSATLDDYYNLHGSGIFDTILKIGKSVLGYAAPAVKVIDAGSKVVDASSGLYNSVKNFNKSNTVTKQYTGKKPTKKQIEALVENET